MKKIAILGCENAHADKFLKFIQENKEFGDVEVMGVYSDDSDAAKKLNEKFGVPVLENYTDALNKVDGLIVTARHGDDHFKFAKPYIETGIPMFIDKPVTITEEDAAEMVDLCRQNNVRLCGGSCYRYNYAVADLKKDVKYSVGDKTLSGYVRGPFIRDNEYGKFYFYAQHLVETVCEIFGRFPLSVYAKENGEQIHVLWHYENYDCVSVFCNNSARVFAARMAEKATKSIDVNLTDEDFYAEFREFHNLLGGAEPTLTYEEFVSPVFIMNAIMRSLESGREEAVRNISAT